MKDMSFFLQSQFPSIESTSYVHNILPYLEQNEYTHFPICTDGIWIGNARTEDLYNLENSDKIDRIIFDLDFFHTDLETQWPILWSLFLQNDSNIIPVLNKDKQLLGVYTKKDLLEIWDETPAMTERGVSILLEKDELHYSFSEISQIVEQNNAKLFSLLIIEFVNNKATILLRTDNNNTLEILNELRRFGYQIISDHSEDNHYNQLKDHSEYLNKYLNI